MAAVFNDYRIDNVYIGDAELNEFGERKVEERNQIKMTPKKFLEAICKEAKRNTLTYGEYSYTYRETLSRGA